MTARQRGSEGVVVSVKGGRACASLTLRIAAASGLVLGLCACGQKLGEADCVAIRDRLQKAWETDASEAVTLAETEQFRRFVKDESARIGARWMEQCRALEGRDVDREELACLRKVSRIDEVEACQHR